MALLPASRARRPNLSELGASSERMAGAYRRLLHPPVPGPQRNRDGGVRGSWGGSVGAQEMVSRLDDTGRQLFRERGRRMVECLLAHLDADAPAPAMANLHEAASHAAEYGAATAALGASLSEAVETFLRFRAPFIDELAMTARKRGLDTREATGLLVDAENAFDKLLLSFMEGWQNA